MKLSFLRNATVALLAVAGLASCGGTATFAISGSVAGQMYPGLVLVETKSGQTITLNDINVKTFSFPNTIDYGTEYEVIVRKTPAGDPPHQSCSGVGRTYGTAGQLASITMGFICVGTPHTVGGTIALDTGTTGSYVGLKLINGSNDLNPFTPSATTTSYSYPGITFDTPYGITILAQPDDTTIKCRLVPAIAQPLTDTPEKVSGKMGDVDVVIKVQCGKVAP